MKQQNKFLLLMFKYVRSSKHCIVHQNVTLIKMESQHIFPYLAVEHGAPSNTRTLLSLIYYTAIEIKEKTTQLIYIVTLGGKRCIFMIYYYPVLLYCKFHIHWKKVNSNKASKD